jgi:hypothetical protein
MYKMTFSASSRSAVGLKIIADVGPFNTFFSNTLYRFTSDIFDEKCTPRFNPGSNLAVGWLRFEGTSHYAFMSWKRSTVVLPVPGKRTALSTWSTVISKRSRTSTTWWISYRSLTIDVNGGTGTIKDTECFTNVARDWCKYGLETVVPITGANRSKIFSSARTGSSHTPVDLCSGSTTKPGNVCGHPSTMLGSMIGSPRAKQFYIANSLNKESVLCGPWRVRRGKLYRLYRRRPKSFVILT